MATYIRTIIDKNDDVIAPRTRAEAVTLSDGTSTLDTLTEIAVVFKGAVANFAALPSTNIKVGDMYYVTADEVHYFWNGSTWATVGSGSGGSGDAVDISIADEGEYFESTNVEGALQEIGLTLEDVITAEDEIAGEPLLRDADTLGGFAAETYARSINQTFSGTITLPSTTIIGEVSSAELSYLDGVTSAIQTQLNGKQATISGALSGLLSGDTDPNRVIVSSSGGILQTSAVTTTELDHLTGVTSSIQTQLNGKAATVHTHAISDVTNLQTELNAKANLSNAIFTGEVDFLNQIKISSATLGTTGTINLDFDGPAYRTQAALTGNIVYTGSSYKDGRSVTVRVINGGTQRTLGFPAGWRFLGVKPANIAANKIGVLTVTAFGSLEADCVAAWAVEQ